MSLVTQTRAGCPANRRRPPAACSRAPPSCPPSCLPTRRCPPQGRGRSSNSNKQPMEALMVGGAGPRTALGVAREQSSTQALPPLARPLPRERSTCEWRGRGTPLAPLHTIHNPSSTPSLTAAPLCLQLTVLQPSPLLLVPLPFFLEHTHRTRFIPRPHPHPCRPHHPRCRYSLTTTN